MYSDKQNALLQIWSDTVICSETIVRQLKLLRCGQ